MRLEKIIKSYLSTKKLIFENLFYSLIISIVSINVSLHGLINEVNKALK